MKNRLMCVTVGVLVGLWLLLLMACVEPGRTPTAEPGLRAATTDTFYGEAVDGRVWGSGGVYGDVRLTATGGITTGTEDTVGQRLNGATYSVVRGYLSFDTSALADDAVISSAVLWLCADDDNSGSDFDVEVYRYAWAEPLDGADREANYDGAYGSGVPEGTLRSTGDGWVDGTYYTMTVATAGISLTGQTKYAVVSSKDVAGTAPTGDERVKWRAADHADITSDPKLVIEWASPTPTPTLTTTPTDTVTPTATSTDTPTATPTPTVTPICPNAILEDTTWGPGTVRVGCNVGVAANTVLTITAGTGVVFLGDHKIDVQGELYAVGTAANPITFTHISKVTKAAWSYIHLRGDVSTLDYCVIEYGRGINDEAGSTIRHTKVMTCTHGLATMSDTAMVSCTLEYNTYGVVPYLECSPSISYSNILSNTWNVWVDQISDLSIWYVWWGSDPPDLDLIWDYCHDFVLGMVDTTFYLASWLSW